MVTRRLHEAGPLGVELGEAASRPGLLVELMLSLLPRRMALCQGMLNLIPGGKEKVRAKWEEALAACAELCPDGSDHFGTMGDARRNALAAIAQLEDVVCGLVNACVKVAARTSKGTDL